jgi:hypothetical protein
MSSRAGVLNLLLDRLQVISDTLQADFAEIAILLDLMEN